MPHSSHGYRQSWSMFPELHEDVMGLLEGHGLNFTFEHADRTSCERAYDTNVAGLFSCNNPRCAAGGWSSKVVPITIRMYHGRRYNARVYHQHCKECNVLAEPELNETYAQRVAYRLKKWSGIHVEPPPYHGADAGMPPHMSELCEGCKAGHCRRGSGHIDYHLSRYFQC